MGGPVSIMAEPRFKIRGETRVADSGIGEYEETLYWSNELGWVDYASADTLTFGDAGGFPVGATGLDFIGAAQAGRAAAGRPVLRSPDCMELEGPICKGHAKNLDTIKRAARDGNLALVECRFRATGETVAAVCAVGGDGMGGAEIVPFAVMLSGNPYELLDPPDPDGGFRTPDETAAGP